MGLEVINIGVAHHAQAVMLRVDFKKNGGKEGEIILEVGINKLHQVERERVREQLEKKGEVLN